MQQLITIAEAAKILDVTLSTVSYYIRSGKLVSVESNQRTAYRRKKKLLNLDDVLQFKNQRQQQ